MDVIKVVDKLAEFGMVRPNKVVGDYYSIYCPIHKDGQERKPSCGILIRDQWKNGQKTSAGWCHCFTCGYAKSLPDLVSDLLKRRNATTDAVEWLKQNVPSYDESDYEIEPLVSKDLMESLVNKHAVTQLNALVKKEQVKYISEEELAKYRFTVPYMYQRKLTDEMIDRYDIGFDANFVFEGRKKPVPCVTFPVRDLEGRTLFLCRRSIEGKLFVMPKGIEKPVYGIYELPKHCKSVVICESCFNAITSTMYGRPAVALFGTGTPHQIEQLKRLGASEFILALDPDDAGDRGRAKLKKALKSVAIVWDLKGIPEGKDINDLTAEEFNQLYLE